MTFWRYAGRGAALVGLLCHSRISSGHTSSCPMQATNAELAKAQRQTEEQERKAQQLEGEKARVEQEAAELCKQKVQLQQNNTKLVLTNIMLLNKAKHLEDSSRALVAKQEDLQHQVGVDALVCVLVVLQPLTTCPAPQNQTTCMQSVSNLQPACSCITAPACLPACHAVQTPLLIMAPPLLLFTAGAAAAGASG